MEAANKGLTTLLHVKRTVGKQDEASTGAPNRCTGGGEGAELGLEAPALGNESHGGGLTSGNDESLHAVEV